jgi:hypothetical protein
MKLHPRLRVPAGALLVAAVLTSTGCNHVSMVDDVDIVFDFNILTGPSDALHTPYVQGASMTIFVQSSDHNEHMAGWTVESANPAVFTVLAVTPAARWLAVSGHAASAGQAVLLVRDQHGNVVHNRVVEVKVPDQVDLLAHGYLIIDRPDEATIPSPQVLKDGTATFLVRYYAGGEQLNGNGALSVAPDAGLDANAARTYLFEDRDWLQVTPHELGALNVTLSAGGQKVRDVTVNGVPQSDVASLRILGVDESRAHALDWLVALGQAYDASGQPLFGANFQWEVDDKSATGLGDLYRYEYDPKAPHKLCARLGSLDAVTSIHGAGFVDSTNRLSCQGAPGLPARSAPIYALIGAALIIALRPRRRE